MKTVIIYLGILLMISDTLQAKTIEIHVSEKPIRGKRKHVFVKPEESVTFNCVAPNFKNESYYWIYNDVTLEEPFSELHVQNVSTRDTGDYNCVVSAQQGALRSETIILKLAEMNITQGPVVFEDRDADADRLLCDVLNHSRPALVVNWLKDEKVLTSQNENLYIDVKGSLIFLYKNEDDLRSKYQCMVTNDVLNISVLGNKLYFLGERAKGSEQSAPRLVSRTSEMIGREGDDVTLECVFAGYPSPNIRWERHGRSIAGVNDKKFNTLSKGRQLIITNVDQSDAGEYKCIGYSSVGEDSVNVKLHVKAGAAIFPKSRIVLSGSDVIFKCTPSDGQSLQWYINAKKFEKKRSSYYVLSSSNNNNKDNMKTVLTIRNRPGGNDTSGLCVQCYLSDADTEFLYSACVKYVGSVDELPTTVSSTNNMDTELNSGKQTDNLPINVGIAFAVIAGCCIVIVIIIIIYVHIRRTRRRRKKHAPRLSTVSTRLKNRASLMWEIKMMEESHNQ